ncbi:hypothetical protein CHUAL_006412 [Chamberlinius hualienensis]
MALLKFLFYVFFIILAAISTVLIIRTASVQLPPAELPCDSSSSHYITLTNAAISRLSTAISIETVSSDDTKCDPDNFNKIRQFIISSYPTLHSSPLVQFEVVNNFSLLYTIRGSNSQLLPYFLTAHLDVVPAHPARWDVPPFEGKIQDEFIYGRGTLDDKSQALGILESLEALFKSGFQPQRGIYVAFGHDEEIMGYNGAKEINRLLAERNVKVLFLMDEGSMILQGVMRMVDNPVAVVSVSEKGYATFRMTVDGINAHSSFPPPTTSIGILAKAVAKLEDNPHPNKFGLGSERTMLELLAPYTNLLFKMLFSNIWLFSPIISRFMAMDPLQNALVRTTTAVTMINGGVKSNVIPATSWAVVNHRIHPTETVDEVLEYDKRIINDDRVNIEVLNRVPPAPISPFTEQTFGFQAVKKSIRQVFPQAVVVPGLMIAATDTKWYHGLTDQVYRFSPYVITPNDTQRYHGDNERISIKNYEKVINFYHHLILNADKAEISSFDDNKKYKVDL